MNKIKKVIQDVIFVSRLTNTRNKKVMTFISVILSQLSAVTDISIIAIFSALIADQFTSIEFVNKIIYFVLDNKFLILILVMLRFIFQYLQKTLIYKIELDVNKNLKIYILNEVFKKRNFSVSDSYFFINVLTMHISFFYSSFSNFLNNLLQITAYAIYLLIADINTVASFSIGILLLIYPIVKLLAKSRLFMHESYEKSQEANKEVERVVDNLFLIKILKKEKFEISRFSKIIDDYIFNVYNNYKFGIVNSLLPSFFTLFVLSLVLAISDYASRITLDFIGVTLRLFQSLGNLANSMNQIINSHVHIEKFYSMETNKVVQNKQNYILDKEKEIEFKGVNFKYFNSEIPLLENVNFNIPKNSHTIITGPNGSGKSTILGLLAGIYYPDSGKVFTYSENFGYIGATPLIFESSIRDNILYGNTKGISDKKIINFLKRLDTFKEEKSYNLENTINNRSLSSGQMQKIAFVRAILNEPDILLLDEATANLDEVSRAEIFKILKEQETTIINSTHDKESFENVDHHLEVKMLGEARKINLNF